jgi:hypothetical protein
MLQSMHDPLPRRLALALALTVLTLAVALAAAGRVRAVGCADPQPGWLACEDFEAGGIGWAAWFAESPFVECIGCNGTANNPERIRLDNEPGAAHAGDWALHMPAGAAAGYQGASLTWRSCAGPKREGCRLTGYEELFFRTWVKLADDHQLVHHFLDISGSRPDRYWDSDGNAGCRPNGTRWAGTTLDFDRNHELFFYTYFPEMRCDAGGYCSGDYVQQLCRQCATKDMPCTSRQECCWGNHFKPPEPVVIPRGRWVCLEMQMRLNTPGQADGSMSFWVDDKLALDQPGMHWRDDPMLQLNKTWLQHYITTGDATQSNRVWFDDMVVSTERIGCGGSPAVSATPVATASASATATVRPSASRTSTPASTVGTTTSTPIARTPTAGTPVAARLYLPGIAIKR